jgi:hypothetical protein
MPEIVKGHAVLDLINLLCLMATTKLLLISEIARCESGIKHMLSGMILLFHAVFQSHRECCLTLVFKWMYTFHTFN